MTRQTFSVTVSDHPMEAWLRQDRPPFVRVEVDPTETVVPGGVRIGVGFPVLEIAGIVKDPAEFAHRIADALNGPDHGWIITEAVSRPGPFLTLQHPGSGREITVNVDREERLQIYRFARPITLALRDVAEERERQRRPTGVVKGEGWSPDHDNRHNEGELSAAAGVYALAASRMSREESGAAPAMGVHTIPANLGPFWPWAGAWWKPEGGVRRMLVKAAALILAEIERLDRGGTTTDVLTDGQT